MREKFHRFSQYASKVLCSARYSFASRTFARANPTLRNVVSSPMMRLAVDEFGLLTRGEQVGTG